MPTEPKKVLCIHDLSGAGRCSLAVILPVLAVMGVQPVALPTMLLSTHTGGLGAPARLDCEAYGHAALAHYRELGLAFDCIYTGYLGSEALVDLAAEAFRLWPDALKVVDPVMADGGRPYSGFAPSVIDKVRDLCRQASLILPNLTEARLLLGLDPALPDVISDSEALDLAGRLTGLFSSCASAQMEFATRCEKNINSAYTCWYHYDVSRNVITSGKHELRDRQLDGCDHSDVSRTYLLKCGR